MSSVRSALSNPIIKRGWKRSMSEPATMPVTMAGSCKVKRTPAVEVPQPVVCRTN